MAMSIMQGGPAPNFLSGNIVSYLLGLPLSPSDNRNLDYKSLCDAVSMKLGFKLTKLNNTT